MRVLGPHLPVCCCRTHTQPTAPVRLLAAGVGRVHTPPAPGPNMESSKGGEGVRFRGRGLAVPLARRPELQGAQHGYFLSR